MKLIVLLLCLDPPPPPPPPSLHPSPSLPLLCGMCHAEAAPYQKWPNSSQAKAAAPPLASPFSSNCYLADFLRWGEKEREIYALASGELAEEKEEEEEEGKL